MVDMLPRLFFAHFRDTSFVAERDGELAGFLAGFLSQSDPEAAYVHFVGVSPEERGSGLGRELTSPANAGSLAFHQAIGFEPSPPQPGYDGPGEERVVLTRSI